MIMLAKKTHQLALKHLHKHVSLTRKFLCTGGYYEPQSNPHYNSLWPYPSPPCPINEIDNQFIIPRTNDSNTQLLGHTTNPNRAPYEFRRPKGHPHYRMRVRLRPPEPATPKEVLHSDPRSREAIHGKPLSKEEVKYLVHSREHAKPLFQIGREGFKPIMVFYAQRHWKRRENWVFKIKCMGIASLDMPGLCWEIEEKTGGKIIHVDKVIVYVFRGRHYNGRIKPVFDNHLYLAQPRAKLPYIKSPLCGAPEGLTQEEADALREKGRSLPPLCNPGKNGKYYFLVDRIRNAFHECDLVRLDCRRLTSRDIVAMRIKLTLLVPCEVLSNEENYLLLWKTKASDSMELGTDTVNTEYVTEFSETSSKNSTIMSDKDISFLLDSKLEGDFVEYSSPSLATSSNDTFLTSGNFIHDSVAESLNEFVQNESHYPSASLEGGHSSVKLMEGISVNRKEDNFLTERVSTAGVPYLRDGLEHCDMFSSWELDSREPENLKHSYQISDFSDGTSYNNFGTRNLIQDTNYFRLRGSYHGGTEAIIIDDEEQEYNDEEYYKSNDCMLSVETINKIGYKMKASSRLEALWDKAIKSGKLHVLDRSVLDSCAIYKEPIL